MEQWLTAKQLQEWEWFYALEPFGEERGDLRIAQLAALTANIHKSRKARAAKPLDFMPYRVTPRNTPREKRDAIAAKFHAREAEGVFKISGFLEPHARAAAVFGDEFNAGGFECEAK